MHRKWKSSVRPENASTAKSRARGIGVKLLLLMILSSTPFSLAADRVRVKELGQKLMCTCGGCGQMLSACNHVSCPNRSGMTAELEQHIDAGKGDEEILDAFVAKYGSTVLSAPPASGGFNITAWIMPFVALTIGGAMLIYFLRKLRSQPPEASPAGNVDTSKYQERIEEELRNYTPED